jgi:hypothetical protein
MEWGVSNVIYPKKEEGQIKEYSRMKARAKI